MAISFVFVSIGTARGGVITDPAFVRLLIQVDSFVNVVAFFPSETLSANITNKRLDVHVDDVMFLVALFPSKTFAANVANVRLFVVLRVEREDVIA